VIDSLRRSSSKADALGVSPRRAAFALGVERIAEATLARGLFP
jgi:hypothetical protein